MRTNNGSVVGADIPGNAQARRERAVVVATQAMDRTPAPLQRHAQTWLHCQPAGDAPMVLHEDRSTPLRGAVRRSIPEIQNVRPSVSVVILRTTGIPAVGRPSRPLMIDTRL